MSDLSFRKKSIPYLGQIYGYNRNEKSDQDISLSRDPGDLKNLSNNYGGSFVPQKNNYIRILRPMRSELVGVYLTLSLRTASTEPNSSFKISVTKTLSETDLSIASLTEAEIEAKHKTIKGNSSPFSNTAGQMISTFKLDLTPLIPKYGNPDFRSDCFVIGLHFLTQPIASGFHLYKFDVNGSALIVRQ